MITISRPEFRPAILENSGKLQTQIDCDAYDACPQKYIDGKSFDNKRYYSRKVVKDKLIEFHHRKCCYCETRYPENIDLDVDHWRPKNAFRQNLVQKPDGRPGYYWLAYRWDNLLLSCKACNTLNKHTYFPLKNPGDRANDRGRNEDQEIPFLVDPTRQDPREHIQFLDDAPIGITPEGKVTIKRLGLDRHELNGERRDYLKIIRHAYAALKLSDDKSGNPEWQEWIIDQRKFLEAAMLPDAKFSSMVIDFFKQNPL